MNKLSPSPDCAICKGAGIDERDRYCSCLHWTCSRCGGSFRIKFIKRLLCKRCIQHLVNRALKRKSEKKNDKNT